MLQIYKGCNLSGDLQCERIWRQLSKFHKMIVFRSSFPLYQSWLLFPFLVQLIAMVNALSTIILGLFWGIGEGKTDHIFNWKNIRCPRIDSAFYVSSEERSFDGYSYQAQICTNAVCCGMDINNSRRVIHVSSTGNLVEYWQEAYPAGRQGIL